MTFAKPRVPNVMVRAASRLRPFAQGLGSRLQVAQDLEFLSGGRLGLVESLGHLEVPARRFSGPLDGGPGVQRDQREFPCLGVGSQDAEVGDDGGGTRAVVAESPTRASSPAVAHGGDEVQALYEGAGGLAQNHDNLPGGGGDLRRPAGSGETYLRGVVGPHDGGVEMLRGRTSGLAPRVPDS